MVFRQIIIRRKPIIGAGLFFLFMIFSCWLQNVDAAQMSDYCITPPYIGSAIEPNLLLMVDNSAGMYDLVYQDSTKICFDQTFSNTKICSVTTTTTCTSDSNCPIVSGSTHETCVYQYSGYFDRDATYSYDSTNKKFTSGATMPGNCTYSGTAGTTKYVCVNSTGTGDSEKVKTDSTGFVATGNFLNWLSMSKFDIEKQVLTGGKYDGANLIAETRGCSGRKFIKVAPNMTSLTFAIRGGSTTGINKITNPATEYGQTYIEIYKGTFNSTACQAAVNDWMDVNSTNLGTLQGDTKDCASGSSNASKIAAFNQVIHDCYWYYTGHGLSNLNVLENTCADAYSTYTNGPADITSPDAPDAICSSILTHVPSVNDGNIHNTIGYLGKCCKNCTQKHPQWDDTCATIENKDFCAGIGAATVPDPASSQILPGTLLSVPGFVMEAGLSGFPMINDFSSTNGPVGFPAKVALSTAPTGLLDKYKYLIRFGAMAFQNNGTASECDQNGYCSITVSQSCNGNTCPSGEQCVFPIPCAKACSDNLNRTCFQDSDCTSGTCGSLTKSDGGTVISYIGTGSCSVTTSTACTVDSDCPLNEICQTNIGDHSSGLIKNIDDIQASSWTPFAEAFYNAMGYFARTNDYPVPPATATPTSRDLNFTSLPVSYNLSKNPSQVPCQKNNILIMTDGMSTADSNSQVDGSSGLAKTYAPLVTSVVGGTSYTNVYGYDSTNKCPRYTGSRSLPVLTWVANHRNIKNLSSTNNAQKHCSNYPWSQCTKDTDCDTGAICTLVPTQSSESIATYVVYTGPQTSTETGMCDPKTLMTAAATNGGTSLFQASNLSQLNTTLASAFDQVAATAASGTAASVLASGEGSGANLIQAVFYPHKKFINSSNPVGVDDEISWIGRLTNLWYYVDPYINSSSIREDDGSSTSTNAAPWSGDKILHLQTDSNHRDYIISMYYDKSASSTKASRWEDPKGNGVIGNSVPTISFENLGYLWEAGTMLWQRDVTTASGKRKIYTSINGTSLLSGNFSSNTTNPTGSSGSADADNSATLASYLQAANATEAANIINWVQGIDVTGYRSRTVKLDLNSNGNTTDTNVGGYNETIARVWKLGDIINSTPRISSWMSLNNYGDRYGDTTYGNSGSLEDQTDATKFVMTDAYKKRGMVYTGGNDGLFHAFKLGTLQPHWTGQANTEKVRLVNPDTGSACSSSDSIPCGKEMWAYIPKQVLPYLKYMADTAYCHVYAVDLSPIVFDASINGSADAQRGVSNWKTIVIGGMRTGGACRKKGSACNDGTTNCVNTPLLDPADNTKGLGYSTYFALDVTDPNNPSLLWEFSHESLGFTTSGPAVVRINGKKDGSPNSGQNGNWFVVLGSGPTGPISTADHQFLGRSDQNLQLFILDLRGPGSSPWTLNTNYWIKDTKIAKAFSGSLMGAPLDLNEDYQDEVLYVPYVKKASSGTWTDGGVGRLMTMKDPDPTNWIWSTLIDGIGPVTSAATKIYDAVNQNVWVFFGTGRYSYVQTSTLDDASGQRYLFGVKDQCSGALNSNTACSTSTSFDKLSDVTDISNVQSTDITNDAKFFGWYIGLDGSGAFTYPPDTETNFMAERVITDPLAASSGVVYFTSYKPYTDLCQLGGKSFIWATQYNTGGMPSYLRGKVLIQVSTGSIEQKDLSEFTDRKSPPFEGKPPEMQGLSVLAAPPAVKRTIHVRER